MPFDPKVHVGVAGVIINPDNELLCLRRQGSTGVGTWGLVGGWIDCREDPDSAIIRELHEEVNLLAQDKPWLIGATSWTWSTEPDTVITLFYQLKWRPEYADAENIEPDKASDLAWISFSELVHLSLFPPLRKFITEGFRY